MEDLKLNPNGIVFWFASASDGIMEQTILDFCRETLASVGQWRGQEPDKELLEHAKCVRYAAEFGTRWQTNDIPVYMFDDKAQAVAAYIRLLDEEAEYADDEA